MRPVAFTFRVALVPAVAALAFAACTAFSSDDSPPPPPDAADDAAAPPLPPPPPAPVDGDADADADADAGCTDFVLVEPFDSPAALAAWTTSFQNGAIDVATALPDGAVPPSPPSALYARGTLPDAGVLAVSAYAVKEIPFLPTTMSVRYALLVPASSAYAEVGCAIVFGQDPRDPTIDVFIAAGELETRSSPGDGGSPAMLHSLTAQPQTQWITIAMQTTLGPLGTSAIVQVLAPDGSIVKSATTESIAATSTVVDVFCGIGYADYGGAATSGPDRIEVVVDDLVIRACR